MISVIRYQRSHCGKCGIVRRGLMIQVTIYVYHRKNTLLNVIGQELYVNQTDIIDLPLMTNKLSVINLSIQMCKI